MQTSSLPKRLPVPFAQNGEKQTIPVASQVGISGGRASYNDGFPVLTRTPINGGGIPPFGTDFNGVLNEITAAVRWQQSGGGYPYDSEFSTTVSGYPKGSLIPNSTNSGFWLNTVDANTTNPENTTSALTGWVPSENYGVTAITGLSASSVTLSTLQASKERITLAGTLSSNINLVVPAWIKKWTIVNNCTGSFTVTVKTPSGTGTAIPAGLTANVIGDGANVIQDTSLLGPSGRLIGSPIVFTSSGTYTPSAGTKTIIVEGVGGGAGGGGSSTPPSGQYSAAGGGSAGTWARAIFPVPTGAVNVTIGTGGSRGAASTTSSGAGEGGQGGDSIFGALLTCPGGKISKSSNSFASNSVCSAEFTDNAASPTVNGGVLLGYKNGAASAPGMILGTYMISGRGGDSPLGSGAIGRYRGGSDYAGGASTSSGYGGGGGGACSGAGLPGVTGGLGASGVFYVWELS